MHARFGRSVLTGVAVFVILWDAKATVPLGTALSNVHGVHAEALYQAPHGSHERYATTNTPEQGRGPSGEGQLSLPRALSRRRAAPPHPSHGPRRPHERVAAATGAPDSNGREARATSLQIKRLLLSLAKCAA